jgi:hypothetical protein
MLFPSAKSFRCGTAAAKIGRADQAWQALNRLPENSSMKSPLITAAAGATAMVLPDLLRADIRDPRRQARRASPVRVRGQVRAEGRGLPRVAVTDGFTVVDTGADGSFELVSAADREFVSVSLPSGYRIPTNPTGTARLYQPIRGDGGSEMTTQFDLEPDGSTGEEHALLLLADIQVQNTDEVRWFREQTVPDVQALAAGMGAADVFGFSCGDIMYDHLELYPEYEKGVQQTGIPFFQVLGNHDMDYGYRGDHASHLTFSRHFGPRYYSFNRGQVHYVVLDDVFWHGVGYIGYLDGDQLAWLAADLERVEPGSTVILAAHIPILGSRHLRTGERNPAITVSVTNREMLYRLLEPFDAHILTGHTHENEHVFEHGVHEHVHGAVCGAWWSGPICADGAPSGYGVYEIQGSDVSWRYKATGHGFDYQIRAYAHGAEPTAPDEIVANVWDWDPAWEVTWYEDGVRRGPMARRIGYDPLSVELHSGPDLPPRRTWVEPYPTGHLFYAPASREAGSITVEAKDRFGRIFSAGVG